MRNSLPFVAAAILGILVAAAMSIFTVDQRKFAIVLQLGEIKSVIAEPGLYFKWPMIQNVRYFEKRILTYEEFEGHPLRRDYPIDRRQARIPKRPKPPVEGELTGERVTEEAGRAHHRRAPMGISKR